MSLKSIILLLAAVFFISHLAFSYNNTIRIEVMGSIPASIDTKKPDDMAVEDAFRKAIAKAVETIVPQGGLDTFTLILDDKIYSNASRYILNYRILSKEIMEDEISATEGGVTIYNVSIEADIALDLLIKDLTFAGIIHEGDIRKLAITILNLRDYKGFELFRNNILRAKGVKSIHYNSFIRDKIEMTVETSGGAQALKQEIMTMYIKDWKIEAAVASGWFSADRIEVRFFPMKGQINQ
ncbi:MAG: hypothetical protein AAB313_02985 [Deltaproteobacteria bacterium]